MVVRRQASLFWYDVPEVEEIRSLYNPEQARLIPAHVTLVREDEVEDWEELEDRIRNRTSMSISIALGDPLWENGLVYLPCIGSTEEFDAMREYLLTHSGRAPRKHLPHVTLIHPRNGTCTDEIFATIRQQLGPMVATFREIALIEQVDGGPWTCLSRYAF